MELKQDHIKKNSDFAPIQDVKADFVSSPSTVRTFKNFFTRSLSANQNESVFLRGQAISRKAVTGNYSTTAIDYLVGVTSLVSAPTIGLPRPRTVTPGKTYIVKDEAGGAATTTITVQSEGEETIDGATTSTLTTNYQAKAFYTDGTNWFTY